MDLNSSQQSPSLQIGLALIDSKIPNEFLDLLRTEQYLKVISESRWWIDQGKFLQSNWNALFPFIREASCSQLMLYDNSHSKIIMDISSTNFILKELKLWGNNIVSIQQLQFMSMPLLKKLYLGGNKITKTSSLNKCKWDALQRISLNDNPIQQLEFCRLKIKNEGKREYACHHQNGHNWVTVMAKMNFNQLDAWKREKGIQVKSRLITSFGEKGVKVYFF